MTFSKDLNKYHKHHLTMSRLEDPVIFISTRGTRRSQHRLPSQWVLRKWVSLPKERACNLDQQPRDRSPTPSAITTVWPRAGTHRCNTVCWWLAEITLVMFQTQIFESCRPDNESPWAWGVGICIVNKHPRCSEASWTLRGSGRDCGL